MFDSKVLAAISHLHRNLETIMIDVAKTKSAEARAVAGIELLLKLATDNAAQMKSLSEQLAAANAANDPVAQAAVQADLDKAADELSAEVDKIAAPAV